MAFTCQPRGERRVDLDLSNIQGNIVPGFNKDHQAFMLVHFRETSGGRAWLKALQAEIATAQEVEAFNTLFATINKRRAGAHTERDGGVLNVVNATWLNVAFT